MIVFKNHSHGVVEVLPLDWTTRRQTPSFSNIRNRKTLTSKLINYKEQF